MSETNAAETVDNTATQGEAGEPHGEPTQTEVAETTDWKAEARKWENRAKENRNAAKELKELKESMMTEAEKEKAHMAEIERELESYKQKERIASMTAEVAKEYGVPGELLRGSTVEDLQAHAELLKQHLNTATAPIVDTGKPSTGGSRSTGDPLRDLMING